MPHAPQFIFASRQHFDCCGCGLCCRRFRVSLTPAELKELQRHEWDNLPVSPYCISLGGNLFFNRAPRSDAGASASEARKDSHLPSCAFLDDDSRCRIHSRLGASAKPLSCRGYPFSIIPTFPGEITVSVRMDCPAVMQDKGPEISRHAATVRHLADELHLAGHGFSESQLCHITPANAKRLIRAIRQVLNEEPELHIIDRMGMLMLFAQHAEQLGAVFLNDTETMDEVYPGYAKNLKAELPEQPRYEVGHIEKATFRRLLTACCRRDEELLKTSLPTRIGWAWKIARILAGRGNLHDIGSEHPDFNLKNISIFDRKCPRLRNDAWENYLRFLDVKLETFQFFGTALYGTDIFTGLKCLFLTFPVAMTLARIHALAEQRQNDIAAEDVNYAVAAIDHSFGRNPAIARLLKQQHSLAGHFSSLLCALGIGDRK